MNASELRTIDFTLNGKAVEAAVAPHHNLVEVLQGFGLFGARESCGQGLCGCCTVRVNGQTVSGCLYLAAFADGADVRTVEGLAPDGTLDGRAERVHRERRIPVRLLHAGVRHDGARVARAPSRPERRRHPPLPVGQPVPVRDLSADHRGGEKHGGEAQNGGGLGRGEIACLTKIFANSSTRSASTAS